MEILGNTQSTILAFVIAVGFAAGLNVYATIFALGMLGRLHFVDLPIGLHMLSTTWVLVASGILFAGEFVADKIPGFDLVWNAAHTFIRIPAAALIAFAAGSQLPPEAHALATVAGGVFATAAHGTKTALRVAVTPSPEPVSNIGLSSAEDVASLGLVWVATHHPMEAAVGVAVLTIGGIVAMYLSAKVIARGVRRFTRKVAA